MARSLSDKAPPGDEADGSAQLSEVVAFLSDPASLNDTGTSIDVVETHWSWVFLTDSRVLKLKKPLWRPWIDLRSLEARRANCDEELRLNRRLTDGVYRRVVPVRRSPAGDLTLDGNGHPVEWLLEMRRLPAGRMLDTLVRDGAVDDDQIERVGARLAKFYAGQPPVVIDGSLYLEHLRREAAQNRSVLGSVDVGLPHREIDDVLSGVDSLLQEMAPQIDRRVEEGRILEGHGDLRPEHVCLTDPIQIFDCLEFDRGMRILDPFDEVNYLGLECEFLGAGWIRPRLLAILESVVGARPPPRLMTLYSAFRATLRARICLAHLDDEIPMEPERWPVEAARYLQVAAAELARPNHD